MNSTVQVVSRLLTTYRWLLLVIFGGIVLHAPLSVGFGVLFPDVALLIKSWKEILMMVAVMLAIVLVTRAKLWGELASDWIFRLTVAYAALHLLLIPFLYQGPAATMAGLAIDLRYVLFFGLVYILVRLQPQARRTMLIVGAVGAVVVIGFGVLQLFLPHDILKYVGYSTATIAPYLTVDQNYDFIRINSTLRGPNPLGAYAGIVLSGLMSVCILHKNWFTARRHQLALLAMVVGSLVVIYVSYSRGALLGAGIAVLIIAAISLAHVISRRAWMALAVAGALAITGVFVARDVPVVSTVIFHEDPAEGGDVNSNDEHIRSLQVGTDRLIDQPFGAGVGSTGSASLQGEHGMIIENHYLFVAHETGWLGLALFVVLFVVVLLRLWQRRSDWLALAVLASGLGLAAIGIFLPVWADDTVSIVWWGLAALALGASVVKKGKQND